MVGPARTSADLLVYARLLQRTYWPRAAIPEGWTFLGHQRHWLTGFDSGVFHHASSGETVIAIKGVRPWDIRDLASVPVRRTLGYPRSTLGIVERIVARHGPQVTLIGHSGGGGIASWLGQQLGLPSITFNAGRTRAALRNDGSKQLNVCIRGDIWGDPEHGLYGMRLPGDYLFLDPPPGWRARHMMGTVIRALEAVETEKATANGSAAR